ncbi:MULTISPECIES: hypothetical protein [Pseudomonas]|uniref:HEPN domain-containing protein n=3 Tax=Pseudomonas TaxID=286 RepID=A0AAE6RBZ9_9PSED|nr:MULTISPECIES: hypothetical protein [Pseudomonas]MDD2124263.1 hypothetical protein [Pseudomonas monteilii]MDI3369155.1 hypothetical protein [Pseudomonas sp. V104_10]QHB27947.1 hypothetical protein TCK1_2601 [Pseudomonas monteilii]BBU45061.1 hypothetical protein PPTS312_29760 [Pseudomonas putida]
MQPHLTPWMVESAYRYCEAAKYLLTGHDMMAIAQLNAAIGMEILLKSFVARPNGNHGKIHETYDLDASMIKAAHLELKRSGRAAPKLDKHDLLTLFYAVPADVRSRLLFDQEEEWIERYRNVFTNARYPYEASSPGGYDDMLIYILGQMIERVVMWYREQGCRDVFIVCHGMTPADFQSKAGNEPEPS